VFVLLLIFCRFQLEFFKPRLHNTTCWQPVVSCIQTFNRLSNPFDNRFDNRLYRVYSRLSNRLYNSVWQPVERTVAVRSTRLSNRLSFRFDNRFDNRLYRINGVSERALLVLLVLKNSITILIMKIGIVEPVTLKKPCLFHADFNHDFLHTGTTV